MAFIGTPLDSRNTFQSLVGKRFNGDGSTTAFTLDVAPSSVLDIEVFVGNVRQDPNSAYTLSGTTLTFTGAPPSGTNNIYVVHQAKSVGTIDPPATESTAKTFSGGVTLSGTTTHSGALNVTGGLDSRGGAVFNEGSADEDFRVESNGSTHMIFVDAGNDKVGINDDAPVGQLHIKGGDSGVTSAQSHANELVIENNTNGGMTFNCGASNSATILFQNSSNADDGAITYRNSEREFRIKTAGSERMRITSDGSVHIGTTTGAYDSTEFFTVNNAGTGSGDAGIGVKTTHINGQCIGLWNTRANGSGDGFLMKFAANGGSGVGSIKTDGSGTAFNTSSDYRLKENVNYSFDATTRLKQLKPARFNWIEDETNTTVDGFLAHEVSSIVPEAISGEKDATTTANNVVLDVNDKVIDKNISEEDWTKGKTDGVYANNTTWKSTETVIDAQSIDQSKLVPLLVKTVQELEARIATLEG